MALSEISQKDFKILDDWDIVLDGTSDYKGQSSISPVVPMAVIYAWPADSPEPEDFRLHEYLHIALSAFRRIPEEGRYDAEEALVQDICRLFRERK
jgi:hypothetical protein